MGRGQLSLEFLLLFLLFLAMLSISIFALIKTREFAIFEIEKDKMRDLLLEIAYKSELVCMLGEGNVQIAKSKLEGFELEKNGEKLKIRKGELEFEEEIPCPFFVERGIYANEVLVEMRDGKVRVRNPN